MATDGFASRIDAVEYAAVDERRMDSSLLMPGPASAPFSARSGRRVNGSGLTVSVGGSPEAWSVSSGAGVICDPAYASQGAWRFEIPSVVSADLPARPGAGQSRIDLIVARIYDTGAIGSGPAEVKVERVNGTSGASPSAPSLPPLSVELGRLPVPASGTISVTQSTRRTVAAGGVLPVATITERDALVTDGVAYSGLTIFNEQTKSLETFNGTGWGGDDTGWIAPPMGSGWVSNSGNGYRRKAGHVTVNLNASKASYATNEVICTLPAGCRPDRSIYVVGQVAGAMRLWFVSADGTVRTTGAGTIGTLGAVTFPV